MGHHKKRGGRFMDFIFIYGSDGYKEDILPKAVSAHYDSPIILGRMMIEEKNEEGKALTHDEEAFSWKNMNAILRTAYKNEMQNAVVAGFDDPRAEEIPLLFKGFHFLILKTVCSDERVMADRMEEMPEGEKTMQIRRNRENLNRPELVNEIRLDTAGLSETEVLKKALELIEGTESLTEYGLEGPGRETFVTRTL
jgi:hypothetical protein